MTIPIHDDTNYDDWVAKSFVLDPEILGVFPNIDVYTPLGNPIAATANRIVTSVNLTNASLTVAGQPDVPRNLTVTITDTTPGATGGILTITGESPAGEAITEVIDCSSFVSTTAIHGIKMFGKVLTAVTSGFGSLGGSGDETIVVGVGKVIALPTDIRDAVAVKHVYHNSVRIAAPIISVGHVKSGVDVSAATYSNAKPLLVIYNPAQ